MAAPLKISIIIHVEDSYDWTEDNNKAVGLYSLAHHVGTPGDSGVAGRNAKLSVQFGRNFLDSNGGNTYPLGAGVPTVLRAILSYGGNFWTHTHASDYANLVSNYSCVRSAFQNEGGAGIFSAGGPGGRSGGWESGGPDWVSITQQAGIRIMNSTAMGAHALVPLSARPYGITDEEIEKLHPKAPAPGPFYTDVMTMRQRPFWMEVASNWFAGANTIYPSYVSSVLMIPAPGKLDVTPLSEGRGPSSNTSFSDDDLKCAFTQAWSTLQNKAYQDTIPNVWYTHLPIADVNLANIGLMGNFVDSLNNLFGIGGMTPDAEWMNMNEIASTFANYTLW